MLESQALDIVLPDDRAPTSERPSTPADAGNMSLVRVRSRAFSDRRERDLRLLIEWIYDRSPARLGRGDRRGRSHLRLPAWG